MVTSGLGFAYTCAHPECANLFRRVKAQKYCDIRCRVDDRHCSLCRERIVAEQPGSKNGYCRSCQAEGARRRREDPAFSLRSVANYRSKNYGLSVEQYAAMSERQGNRCTICKQPETARTNRRSQNLVAIRSLNVDHDHETGRIRGLLCSRCNTALGLLGEDVQTLIQATAYLAVRL